MFRLPPSGPQFMTIVVRGLPCSSATPRQVTPLGMNMFSRRVQRAMWAMPASVIRSLDSRICNREPPQPPKTAMLASVIRREVQKKLSILVSPERWAMSLVGEGGDPVQVEMAEPPQYRRASAAPRRRSRHLPG